MQERTDNVSQEGDHALLVSMDRKYWVFAHLVRGSKVKITKTQFKVEPLLGVTYGSVFELRNKSLTRVEGKLDAGVDMRALTSKCGDGDDELDGGDDAAATLGGGDDDDNVVAPGDVDSAVGEEEEENAVKGKQTGNAPLICNSQALSAESISQMKAEGKAGHEIIAALIENSSTFAAKTEFAQQKYLKKKTLQCVCCDDVCFVVSTSALWRGCCSFVHLMMCIVHVSHPRAGTCTGIG
jgi:hypothetical protein